MSLGIIKWGDQVMWGSCQWGLTHCGLSAFRTKLWGLSDFGSSDWGLSDWEQNIFTGLGLIVFTILKCM